VLPSPILPAAEGDGGAHVLFLPKHGIHIIVTEDLSKR